MPLTTIVKTVQGREHWLSQCLASIPTMSDVLVVRCTGYEPGGLLWVLEHTDLDRWLYIQDSVTVTTELYGLLGHTGSVALNDCPAPFGSFMGVYEREHLYGCEPTWCATKEDAIKEELEHGRRYAAKSGAHVLFKDMRDKNGTVTRIHDEDRLKIANPYMTKYKGTWR